MSQINAIAHFMTLILQNNPDYQSIDTVFLQNQILALAGVDSLNKLCTDDASALETVQTLSDQEITRSQLLSLYTPKPSTFNRIFWNRYDALGPQAATSYFYRLVQNNGYLQRDKSQKNRQFVASSPYGLLELTINLAKPEKTAASIAAAQKSTTHRYPKCALCFENEGYLGGGTQALRSQHRLAYLTLNGKRWGLQYSPYAYFKEHLIVISRNHEPMKIDMDTYRELLEFVTIFPHYFLGSNAGLPIVGGSVLNHEHYQGGAHQFPIEKASVVQTIPNHYPGVVSELLNWPITTFKLTSTSIPDLVRCASELTARWKRYDDADVDIVSHSGNQEHHTITPLARKTAHGYTLLLLLRDNHTTTEFPGGVFHVHPEYQHIKQENIGLIEAFGLAILPGRLNRELVEVKKFLRDQPNQMKPYHLTWAKKLKQAKIDTDLDLFLQKQLGGVFQNILENCGVIKDLTPQNPHLKRLITFLFK